MKTPLFGASLGGGHCMDPLSKYGEIYRLTPVTPGSTPMNAYAFFPCSFSMGVNYRIMCFLPLLLIEGLGYYKQIDDQSV